MKFEVATYSNADGIQKQILIINDNEYEINGLDLWEGEVLKVKNKEYELSLKNWRHGKNGELDLHVYSLEEVEYYTIKDGTEVVRDLLGEKFDELF